METDRPALTALPAKTPAAWYCDRKVRDVPRVKAGVRVGDREAHSASSGRWSAGKCPHLLTVDKQRCYVSPRFDLQRVGRPHGLHDGGAGCRGKRHSPPCSRNHLVNSELAGTWKDLESIEGSVIHRPKKDYSGLGFRLIGLRCGKCCAHICIAILFANVFLIPASGFQKGDLSLAALYRDLAFIDSRVQSRIGRRIRILHHDGPPAG